MKKTKRFQRGFVPIAILGVILFIGLATIALQLNREMRRQEKFVSEANSIMQVRNALQRYAAANQASFKSGKTVMYVNDQYAPLLSELKTLGFMTTTGLDVTTPFGSTYATKLTLNANGSIDGMVYLTGSIKDRKGNPDTLHACGIAQAMDDIGICSNYVTPSKIGNTNSQYTNPTSLPAVVGALVFIPS